MEFANEPIFQWMSQFAYEPMMVYLGILVMMALSAVGFPLPEEVTLVSVGILVYMGANPDIFPPPVPGAPVINVHTAAAIAFFAVLGSDFLIYTIGRIFGRKMLYHPRIAKFLPEKVMKRVENWTEKYGAYACGIFRFTPGLRFPGHLACGMLEFPVWKFIAIDGVAALLSVPTQIYLLAFYGESVLYYMRQFKIVLVVIFGCAIFFFIGKKLRDHLRSRKVNSI